MFMMIFILPDIVFCASVSRGDSSFSSFPLEEALGFGDMS